MRWPGRQSLKFKDVEDPSGGSSGSGGSGGLSGPILTGSDFRGARMGLAGALLVILMSVIFQRTIFKSRPSVPLEAASRFGSASRSVGAGSEGGEQFLSYLLDDVQKTWEQILPQAGIRYRRAQPVFFRDYTTSGCGAGQSATGPFYCPADEKIYLDLGFFGELAGQPEERFAQAYVIAHELGHHVQKLLGSGPEGSANRRTDGSATNQLPMEFELQADCLAGVWAHATGQRNIVDKADIAAGMDAAAAVGGDRVQKMAQGHFSPETFAYGSAPERLQWFRRGLDSGAISSCQAFASEEGAPLAYFDRP